MGIEGLEVNVVEGIWRGDIGQRRRIGRSEGERDRGLGVQLLAKRLGCVWVVAREEVVGPVPRHKGRSMGGDSAEREDQRCGEADGPYRDEFEAAICCRGAGLQYVDQDQRQQRIVGSAKDARAQHDPQRQIEGKSRAFVLQVQVDEHKQQQQEGAQIDVPDLGDGGGELGVTEQDERAHRGPCWGEAKAEKQPHRNQNQGDEEERL